MSLIAAPLRRSAAYAVLGLVGLSMGWLLWASRPASPPTFAAVREAYRSSEARLLDRHGALLQTMREDYTVRRLHWVSLAELSPALIATVIQAEDRRFREHHGVDLHAVAAAVIQRGQGESRGASTVDMQVAAQLDPALTPLGLHRTVLQKLRQIRAAWRLDAMWTKDQILEAYFNRVSFRGEWQGIAAASSALFHKAPLGLSQNESWILAALLPAPTASMDAVARRACALAQADAAACSALRAQAYAALAHPSIDTDIERAPQLARRLLRHPGETIISTLDGRIQDIATAALSRQLAALASQHVRDGAALVVDNRSGEVLAYVGSVRSTSHADQVDGVTALRQAGSTLKPFLYAQAIERKLVTAASLLEDAPLAVDTGAGLYAPQNYEHDFKGLVSVRTALAGSLNVPAVRTLMLVGLEPFRQRLHDLGYVEGLTEAGDYYGYSLALGSADVSLIEQVAAYRTLAAGGQWKRLSLVSAAGADSSPLQESTREVMTPQAAFIVADILADRSARAVTFGLDSTLATPYWSAAKTGTSKNMRDNWCLGFSSRYTVGVWVGNFEGDPMRTVSGVTGAAPAWREIMDALMQSAPNHAADLVTALVVPEDVVSHELVFDRGVEPARREWFIAGTETAVLASVPASPASARIATPSAGEVIALDPDIPFPRQHVAFRSDRPVSGGSWRLDGRMLPTARAAADTAGVGAGVHLWTPIPGSHRLELLGPEGKPLDQVAFSVRALTP